MNVERLSFDSSQFDEFCKLVTKMGENASIEIEDGNPVIVYLASSQDIKPPSPETLKALLKLFKEQTQDLPSSEKALIHLIKHYQSRGEIKASEQLTQGIQSVNDYYKYKMALESQDPEQQLKLGLQFKSGKEVKKSISKAIQLLEMAAKGGDQTAPFYLIQLQGDKKTVKDKQDSAAVLFERGYSFLSGSAETKDLEQARYYLELAAKKDFTEAQALIGYMLTQGIGGETDITTDCDKRGALVY